MSIFLMGHFLFPGPLNSSGGPVSQISCSANIMMLSRPAWA